MNIGIFTDTYYPNVNGVVRSIETLRENLENLGHTVYIITNGKVDYEEENVHRIGTLPLEILEGYKIALPYSYKIYKDIKRLKLDVIHTHTEWSVGVFGRICATRLKIPYVHTFHTMYENYTHYMAKFKTEKISKRVLKQIIRSHCNHTQGVIAPSLKAKLTLEEYGVKRTIHITPTGISLDKFRAEITDEAIAEEKARIGIAPDDFVGLYIGRLAKEKNIEPIIQAIGNVDSENFKFLVVGGGPERENLENLAKKIKCCRQSDFCRRETSKRSSSLL
jgi:1,2-diacylglycerol 3-alpha-glucosyltransferase